MTTPEISSSSKNNNNAARAPDYLSVSYDYDTFTMKLPGKTLFKLKTKQNIFCERSYKAILQLRLIVIILYVAYFSLMLLLSGI